MKVLSYVLFVLGVLNIVKGVGISSEGASGSESEAITSVCMGVLFILGGVYSRHRSVKEKAEIDQFDKKEDEK